MKKCLEAVTNVTFLFCLIYHGSCTSCLMSHVLWFVSHIKLVPECLNFALISKVAIKIIPSTRFKTNVRAQAAIRNEVEAMRVGHYARDALLLRLGKHGFVTLGALPRHKRILSSSILKRFGLLAKLNELR